MLQQAGPVQLAPLLRNRLSSKVVPTQMLKPGAVATQGATTVTVPVAVSGGQGESGHPQVAL